MSQFFLELFSEEMPTTLQKNARENILKLFKDSFSKSNIIYKSGISYSTPNRLVFLFEGLPIKIHEKALKIKGPRTDAPKQALEGFIKSNNLDKKNIILNIEGKVHYRAKVTEEITKHIATNPV